MKTQAEKAANIAQIVYILQAISFFTGGLAAVVALIINYVKRDEVKETWVASHFRWQMRTFWFGLLWGIVGVITLAIFIGGFILVANAIWVIYRVVKGWLNLNDEKSMYQGT